MKRRIIVNVALVCIGECLQIVGHLSEMIILDSVGWVLFLLGVIMLPKTASIVKEKSKKKMCGNNIKHYIIANVALVCIGECLRIIGRLTDLIMVDRIGWVLFVLGVIMLPKTASIVKEKSKKKESDDME